MVFALLRLRSAGAKTTPMPSASLQAGAAG